MNKDLFNEVCALDANHKFVLLKEYIDEAWRLTVEGKTFKYNYGPGTLPYYGFRDAKDPNRVVYLTPGDEVILSWDGMQGHPAKLIRVYMPDARYWHNITLSNIHANMRNMAIRISK